ncbi:MAG TPA: o-succinylbenzoate synthase [Mycobacteriales bacterium]|nr:o-succinylbenzoate synthase [Mycobacteriales bacterium]
MQIHVVALPMRAPFRGITVREAVLLRGPAGWAEFSPFIEYGDAEAATWLAAAREAATEPWPGPVREQVPVNATVPALPAAAAAELVRRSGCTTAKVKVAEPGQELGQDVERVAAVRDALGPDGRIRIDANAGWSVENAVPAIRALDAAAGGLEYVEQPCPSVEELAECRRRVGVPIAADESIRKAEDPLRVQVAGAADIAVIKVAPLGGVRRALRVAEACGLPCVVSSAIDTSVGLAAGIALAARLPRLPYACGLGTATMFPADVTAQPLRPVAGMVPVRRVEPDPQRLAELAAPPDRDRWWRERLARCAALLP